MVQSVVDKLKWKIGDRIQVGFIDPARCLLLKSAPTDDGFTLAYSNARKNARKKTGGRVYCVGFIRNYLATIVVLPKRSITPVFLSSADWSLALPIEPLNWQSAEFSMRGADTVPKDAIGVYQLLANQDLAVRIGQGRIHDRIREHLKDERFRPPSVRRFRYLALSAPEDPPLVEKILLAQYEAETGVLPRFQEIRA